MNECKRIYGCVSTFEGLTLKGDIILDCAVEFIDKIVKPLGKVSELRIGYCSSERQSKKLKYSKTNIEKVRNLFKEGRILSFNINFYDYDKGYITLNFYYCSNASNIVYASIIDFSVDGFYYDTIPSYVQEACIEIIMKLSSKIDSVGGFITHDHLALITADTPHEEFVGRAYPWASREFDKYYRGYQWGNFLSRKHVEMLGGIERVMIEAPVYKAVHLSDGGVFLQLTKDINSFSDEDLKKLKKFLKPILPPKIEKVSFTRYQNLRIVIDEDEEDIEKSNLSEVIPDLNINDSRSEETSSNEYEEFDFSNYEKLFEIPTTIEINEDIFFNDIQIIYHITENLESIQESIIINKVDDWKEININDTKEGNRMHHAGSIVFDKDEKIVAINVGMGLSSIDGFIDLVKFIYEVLCDYTDVSKINII